MKDDKTVKSYIEGCYGGKQAPCSDLCPFHLDIRSFIRKMQAGDYKGAYRIYREKVVFPDIISRICDEPCRTACRRKTIDESLHIADLERSCIALTPNKEAIYYNIPHKMQKVTVIGAGLSGLACALRLSAKKYDITVYEKTRRIGGVIYAMLPSEIYLKDINAQFGREQYDLRLDSEIESLNELDYNAVYIATGRDGNDFGMRDRSHPDNMAGIEKDIFLGGRLLGATPVSAVAHGLKAAMAIEAYLKTGLRKDVTVTKPVTQPIKAVYNQKADKRPGIKPKGEVYDAEEAKSEAVRCLLCDCKNCKETCELLSYHNKMPHRVADDVLITLNPVANFTDRVATRLIHGCNMCGKCEKVCPVNIDLGRLLLDARREMHRQKAPPPVFHDFWLRDMDHAMGPAYLAMTPAKDGKCRRVFFPGCQLGASEPQYVMRAYEFLKQIEPDTGIMLACCGVPAEWAGDQDRRDQVHAVLKEELRRMGNPEIITACPACEKTLSKYLPEYNYFSLYYLLSGSEGEKITIKEGSERVAVFDPCAVRYDKKTIGAVRELLIKSGYQIEELDNHGENAVCCGFGGHIYPAYPEQLQRVVKIRISENDLPYIVYCSNCRDIFEAAGKDCRHILEAVFGIERRGQALEISERHRNRLKVRRSILKDQFGLDAPLSDKETLERGYRFSRQAVEEMEKTLLLRTEVINVVETAEKSGCKIYDKDRDLYISHLPIGVLTIWAEYRKEKEVTEIISVYSHRMRIEEI